MRLNLLHAVVLAILTFPAGAQTVLELYTSQGCSSCPPADALLGALAQRGDVLALAFHVDYWDDIGWRDPFSMAAASQRQRRYVQTLGLPSAFTPQLIIDGRASVVGSDQGRILRALSANAGAAALPVVLSIGGGYLNVQVPARSPQSELDINLVGYLAKASTAVGRGENSGRTLTEFNIVRQLRRLGGWSGQQRALQIPLSDLAPDVTDVAILLQRAQQGAILGSAKIAVR